MPEKKRVFVLQIIIQMLGFEEFTTAYGYLLIFEGLGFLTGAPVAGTDWVLADTELTGTETRM